MLLPAFFGADYAGGCAAAASGLNMSGTHVPQAIILQESSPNGRGLLYADADGNQVFQLLSGGDCHDLRNRVQFGPEHDFLGSAGQAASVYFNGNLADRKSTRLNSSHVRIS